MFELDVLNELEDDPYPTEKEKFIPSSSGLLRSIRKLIADECAQYQRNGPMGVKNSYWVREKSNSGICVFFNQERPKCTYFKRYVLPLDAGLEEDYLKGGNNGGEATNRAIIPRKGPGRSPGGVTVIVKKPLRPGVSVGESLRQGVLSRAAFHGVGPGK